MTVLQAKAWVRATQEDIVGWSQDFLDHFNSRWDGFRVGRFILATAATNLHAEVLVAAIRTEQERFRGLGLHYEVWGPEELFDRLRRDPLSLRQFLGPDWATQVYGGDDPYLDPIAAEARAKLSAQAISVSRESLISECEAGNVEGVRLLLRAGLSSNVRTADGLTPADVALKGLSLAASVEADDPYVGVLSALGEAGVSERTMGRLAHDALTAGNRIALTALILSGVPADVLDLQGRTLAAQAMRADARETHHSSRWSELVSRGAWRNKDVAIWMMCWAARTGRNELLRRLGNRVVDLDITLPQTPGEPVETDESALWVAGGSALHQGAATGIRIVRQLVAMGADVEAVDSSGRTPLHIAAEADAVETVRLLLRQGAAPLRTDHAERLPLDYAGRHTRPILLNAMADFQDPSLARAALARACNRRDDATVRALILKGADPNAANEEEPAPLFRFAYWLDFSSPWDLAAGKRCIETLLSLGADPQRKDKWGSTALHRFAERGDVDIARMLLARGAQALDVDEKGSTALMWARDEIMASLLISEGCDPHQADFSDYRAVDHAAMTGCNSLVEWYGHQGISPHPNAVLFGALHAGEEKDALAALTNGASPTAVDLHGMCALHLAAECWMWSVVDALLRAGADVQGPSAQGSSALGHCLRLRISALRGLEEFERTVEVLLDAGASVEHIDRQGRPAILAGIYPWVSPKVANRLFEPCATSADSEGQTTLMSAASYATSALFGTFLPRGGPIDRQDREGRTALTYAVRSSIDAIEKVDRLLNEGADPNVRDNYGRTVLFPAAASPEYGILERLIEAGGDVKSRCNNGETPLLIAAREGRYHNVQLLIEEGAQAAPVASSGETPLSAALRGGHVDVYNLILTIAGR
ncbi:ankyrin repeat domain-containing protein [Methylocystis sp. H62]|uniref:ankyrin repeat domain-containing protein n=1 Tax=Methylocystis sp. H62 TaxID=2785789 RepID=UPI0018C29217|nr:ankyrin repeat domain-containing protein [Methylocystis sp. H62]MBG0792246.1 ankyrin repeat domain-containing protein [Methylocystis sp. H62]